MQRRKILYIVPRFRYMNRTGDVFLKGLHDHHDVFLFGPGYVSSDILKCDLRQIDDRYGPFDIAFIHQYFSLNNLASASTSAQFSFSVDSFLNSHPNFPVGLNGLDCPIFTILLQFDPYALSDEHFDRLISDGKYLITWDRTWGDSFTVAEGIGFKPADAATQPTDNFRKLYSEVPHRIIPTHHMIGDDEFLSPTWDSCPYDISVPGISYQRRKDALSKLHSSGMRVGKKPIPLSIARFAFIGRPYRYNVGLDIMWHYYKSQISESRMSFAEGSIFNYPVRKFFEVPTFGTLLVAIPPNDSENIGFVSGETYVEATEDGLVDTAVSILRDPDRAKYIMQNAQQMIRDIHSSSARMAQIFSCIDRIFEGTYAGATWVKGRVKIVSPV